MTTQTEALKLALEALEELTGLHDFGGSVMHDTNKAITALREALAEQPAQQEPVAWMQDSIELYVQDRPSAIYTIPLYTTPQAQPAREWVGLTEDEFDDLRDNNFGISPLISAVEAKLKEKNTS